MANNKQWKAAKAFVDEWYGRGYEKGESQSFWLALLRDVLGVPQPEKLIRFESQVHLDHASFIDGYIDQTHVLIEQKSIDKDLRQPVRQSDGKKLTPFQQAKRYAAELPYSKRPRWVVTCNFRSFLIYDMEQPTDEPEEILLVNLPAEYYRLQFLVDTGDKHVKQEVDISLQAGEIVGLLYDALLKQYLHPDSPESLRSLNVLCVRLVFCLYAEDAGMFGRHGLFHDYLAQFPVERMRGAIIELFKLLNTPISQRDPYLNDELLAAFPYVNGGLFASDDIEIPNFNLEIANLLLRHASDDFDWSRISPTIFGAVFESTLNPVTRREGGMHYTSVENIHRVIGPLFLDGLQEEWNQIKVLKTDRLRTDRIRAFQRKLASLRFLDPACGSGNFLTETYLSLRRLENECLRLLQTDSQIALGGDFSPIQVSIGQFYGIEINDFAVSVARTALWIAEAQMMAETERIVGRDLEYLPLKSYPNIVEANALRIDWDTVCPRQDIHYIMGNPPFVGYSLQSKEQKEDILSVYVDKKGKPYKTAGKIDYVAAWYFKASRYIDGTSICVAFVSTNSITQGEQVASVWKPLYDRFYIHIDFAWRTFKWESEAAEKSAVHVVIVGFSQAPNDKPRQLFDGSTVHTIDNINAYLTTAPDVFVTSQSKPLCAVPIMSTGNRPTDGGHLIIEADEYADFIKREPKAKRFIKKLVGAKEYINNLPRYCLWLVDATPAELRSMPLVMERIKKVREIRLASPKKATQDCADTPTIFQEIHQPDSTYIVVPKVSSERRKYVPIGFMSKDIIVSDLVFCIPNTTLYHFGILTSSVHMAWMRTVCGRLKSDYRYSKDIVYNNFPWPEPTEKQRQQIEAAAQAILDARALYPDSSLADLYDTTTMPPELRDAHRRNDRAVMAAYDFPLDLAEEELVARLLEMYETLIQGSPK